MDSPMTLFHTLQLTIRPIFRKAAALGKMIRLSHARLDFEVVSLVHQPHSLAEPLRSLEVPTAVGS